MRIKNNLITIIFVVLNSYNGLGQDILNGKVRFGNETAGKWFKISTLYISCNYNSVNVDFDIDYVDTYAAYHIDGLIRFRKGTTNYTATWFYYQYGYLFDGLKLKDLGSGNYELWIKARGNHGHVMTGLEITRECNFTATILETKVEVIDPEAFDDVSFSGNFNLPNHKLAVGSHNPDQALTIDGTIHAEEVIIDLDVPAPDYVFEPDYNLRTLQDTKAYITKHKHLPEIPSAKEMETNGVELGDMNMKLLKKIEELTLYQIELEERLEKHQKEITELKNQMAQRN